MSGGHEVAIHFSSDSVNDWNQALQNLSNLYRDDSVPTPPDRMTVVVNGAGVRFLLDRAPEADQVRRIADAGVNINACRNSLERFGYGRKDLIDGVGVVPSGVAELVRLQRGDTAYLKLP